MCELRVTPEPQERRSFRDFFGNQVTSVAWHVPVDSVTFELLARTERIAPQYTLDFSAPLAEIAAELATVRDVSGGSPHHFTASTRRTEPSGDMVAFARHCIARDMTALAATEAIGRALHKEMRFDAKATDVDTLARDAFRARHGVCQDFSHIMIACLRAVGIPAGYVSGFLRTLPPPGQPRLEGADAMHAWVKAWVGGETGWIEFDPTNDQFAGVDYINVGYGRDYDDVAPVRGALRASGAQRSKQAVDVIPLIEA